MRKIFVADSACTDERLMQVADRNPLAALLWPWFLLSLDDWGRGAAAPRQLRARLFPENAQVTVDLIDESLELYGDAGLVTLYEVDGRRYVAVEPAKWFRYQTHIRSEKRQKDGSRYPAPPSAAARTCAQLRESARTSCECCASPSPSPSPSPSEEELLSDSCEPDECDTPLVGELVLRDDPAETDFPLFWEHYPRHEARKAAAAAWRRLNARDRQLAAGVAQIMGELVRQGVQERRFCPHAATFLNGRRWEDWRDGVPPAWRPPGEDRAAAQDAALAAAVARAKETTP